MKKLHVLGPEGTFSWMVANKINAEKCEIVFEKTIPDVGRSLNRVPGSCGVLPIENTMTGVVGQAQDVLVEENLWIVGETSITISFHLITNQKDLSSVKILYCHPQAFNQCARFIAENLPNAREVYRDSNIHAFDAFFEKKNPESAALVPSPYFEAQNRASDLGVAAHPIHFDGKNSTRFLKVTANLGQSPEFSKPKTSIYIEMKKDEHSFLFTILSQFNRFQTNLSLLHSKPNPNFDPKVGPAYCFFIDFENTRQSEECLQALKDEGIDHRVIGTYGVH